MEDLNQWEYREEQEYIPGMCDIDPHTHTLGEDPVSILEIGDWLLPEPDGEQYCIMTDDAFQETF